MPAKVPSSTSRRIQTRRSGVHGKGVFALQDIGEGETIIEYVGEIISWKEAQARHPHDPKACAGRPAMEETLHGMPVVRETICPRCRGAPIARGSPAGEPPHAMPASAREGGLRPGAATTVQRSPRRRQGREMSNSWLSVDGPKDRHGRLAACPRPGRDQSHTPSGKAACNAAHCASVRVIR